MKRFEYQTKTIDAEISFMGGKVDSELLNQMLNYMGRECWELVEVVASNKGIGETRCLICIFKRELE